MRADFEHSPRAQFAETGPFKIFILPDGARAYWGAVAFFVGLGLEGGPLPDPVAARKLKESEADAKADPLVLNRGPLFDRERRHLRIDGTTT
jgi:hypothetical protein